MKRKDSPCFFLSLTTKILAAKTPNTPKSEWSQYLHILATLSFINTLLSKLTP